MIRDLICVTLLLMSASAPAQTVLFENVRIFNGVDKKLSGGHVLVEDGIISKVSRTQITPPDDTIRIDGDNRVLSPGFIDLHVHLTGHVPQRWFEWPKPHSVT